MANRFPLTIDGSTIKELPSGDNLDLTGSGLVTVSNADIELDPNGSGTVVLKGNATKGAGQLKLNCENNSHGITLKGPPHSASANYTLTLPNTDGNANQVLKTDGSGNLDWVDSGGGGGGGAWNVISNSTVSSAVSTVEFTSITGYTHYSIDISNLKSSGNKEFQLICEYGGSGSYTESGYVTNKLHTGTYSGSAGGELQTSQSVSRISKDMSDTVGGTVQLWFGNSSSTISFRSAAFQGTAAPNIATGVMSNSGTSERDAAITKIKFSFQSGTIDSGTFTLYGLSTS